MATTSGSAKWQGGIRDGKGAISTKSGALKDYPYGFASRFEGKPGSNPEELIGAAHAACFTMALSLILGEAKLTAEQMETKADVIKGVTSGTSKNLAVEFKSTKVVQFGNIVITYHDMVFVHPTVTNKVFTTMVWAKQGPGWQLVQRQATKLPD